MSMIIPPMYIREDQPDDEYYEIPHGNQHLETGSKVNLTAVRDYAALGLSGPQIAVFLGISEKGVYSAAPIRKAYNLGRGIRTLRIQEEVYRRMQTSDTILGKLMDRIDPVAVENSAIDEGSGVEFKVKMPAKVTIEQPTDEDD